MILRWLSVDLCPENLVVFRQSGSNSSMLNCSVVSYSLWHRGLWPARHVCLWESSGRILEWVAIPFSREFSQSRDQTQVSYTAGGFFSVRATGEILYLDGRNRVKWVCAILSPKCKIIGFLLSSPIYVFKGLLLCLITQLIVNLSPKLGSLAPNIWFVN